MQFVIAISEVGKTTWDTVGMATEYDLEMLRRQMGTELSSQFFITRLHQSVDGILRIMDAIRKTKGEQWADHVLDSNGKELLTPEEKAQFTAAAKPLVPYIVEFFGKKTIGGADEVIPPSYEPIDVAELADMTQEELDAKRGTVGTTGQTVDPEKMAGIDNIYEKVVDRVGRISDFMNEYASKYGVLRLEKEHDLEPDIRLVPEPVAQVISKGTFALTSAIGMPILPQATMSVLEKLKVPFRLLTFIIYLVLDVARISANIAGNDEQRKMLSMVVSLLDLLKGDWKKAILSFMGYYGSTPFFVGQMGKLYLTLFEMLSPTIQQSMIYGTLDTTKSFMIGVLLTVFQVTAPESMRLPLIGMLEKIAKKKAEIDGTLVDAGLSAREDHFAPTFDDFNNIQSLMDDPEFICSTEFETLIEQVNQSAVINMILQILRIPVTKEFRAYRCGTKPSRPFLTLIVNKAKERKEQQERAGQDMSSDDLQMPVSGAMGATGMNQGPTGMNQGPTGMNQGPTGMNQGPTGMNQGPTGMNQGIIEGTTGTQLFAPGGESQVAVPATPAAPAADAKTGLFAPGAAAEPKEQPAETPVEAPKEQPAAEPKEQPAAEPKEQPAEMPVEAPNAKTGLFAPGAKGGRRRTIRRGR